MPNQTTQDAQVKKKRSKLRTGCTIGCGGIMLIIIIFAGIGYYLVKDSITAFEETEASMKLLAQKYGNVEDYCPEPDGTIKPDRLNAFIQVREGVLPLLDEMEQSVVQLIGEINRAEDEGESFGGVIGLIKNASKILPQLAKYFTTRNRKLMDVGMGLGEYFYIYVTVYYSWLGKSPADGPDFRFLGGGSKNSSLYFAVQEMVKDKDKEAKRESRHEESTWESEGVGSISRVRGFILSMMQCQLKKMETGAPGDTPDTWPKALEAEIEIMKKQRRRMPWKEGLPGVLKLSLQPFAERLKACYGQLINPLEFGLYKH
ncbi:MAG: hypothetical protein GY950_08680 [bacterium]|nr:hypothetical protein [bacterium]